MTTDAHIHFALDGGDWRRALDRHRQVPDSPWIQEKLQAYAQAGTTYLRDGGDRFGACVRAGELAPELGIEYATPLFPIHEAGNYGSFIGRAFSSEGEYQALVDEVKDRGGDFVKLMLTGIMDFDHYGVLTGYAIPSGQMRSMVAYAHAQGLPVMAHVNGAQAIKDAVAAGVDSIEHGYYSDEESRALLAASSTIWVPTLAPVGNLLGTGRFSQEVLERILQDQLQAVAQVAAAGGLIAQGSDAGAAQVFHVQALADETAYLHQALGEGGEQVTARGNKALRERFPRLV